jgi:hypothetical protein
VRLEKAHGLVVVVAVFAAALIGPSAATAGPTALCKKHEQPCAGENIYQGHFEAVAQLPQFLTENTTITCKAARILGFALGLAAPQLTHLQEYDFSEHCLTTGGQPCVVKATELGLLLTLRVALNVAQTQTHAKVLVSCPMIGIHCVYGGLPTFEFLGSPNGESLATIHSNEVLLEHGEGLLCPEETKFDALFQVLQPDPIAITG